MYLEYTDSTNTLIKEHYLNEDDGFCVYTFDQRAGRGQSGNRWNSEAGKNLLFSILLQRPKVDTEEMFTLNMAVSLGIRDVLSEKHQLPCTIKWPNDIYIGNKKVCGILIENVLDSQGIRHSIVGAGVNVHQTQWDEAIPNPTSMKAESGEEYDLHVLMEELKESLAKRVTDVGNRDRLKREYQEALYRREGFWPFEEREVDITPTAIAKKRSEGCFEARIADVTHNGLLILEKRNGENKAYHFKEVKFVIED